MKNETENYTTYDYELKTSVTIRVPVGTDPDEPKLGVLLKDKLTESEDFTFRFLGEWVDC